MTDPDGQHRDQEVEGQDGGLVRVVSRLAHSTMYANKLTPIPSSVDLKRIKKWASEKKKREAAGMGGLVEPRGDNYVSPSSDLSQCFDRVFRQGTFRRPH